MLRSLRELMGYKLSASDGEIGKLHDFYFDDEMWIIRYLVADTGKWLPGRKILISPLAIDKPDWSASVIPVNLTTEQIEESPDIGQHEPVSRQKEKDLLQYYDWPLYWEWEPGGVPPAGGMIPPQPPEKKPDKTGDPHLRSVHEVIDYGIQATDGNIGHVEDFIGDDQSFIIRYIAVDTRNWLPGGKKVLISPAWIENVEWEQSQVFIDVSREKVENSPEYDPSQPVNREFEVTLYDFYGRPKYWRDK